METPIAHKHVSTKDGYDRWSELYDQDDIPLNLLEESVVEEHLKDIHGQNILDLGCGTGRQSFRMAKAGASVVGLDQSSGMLSKAHSKNLQRLAFKEHDLSKPLPFDKASFDIVTSFLVLEHIEELTPFFKECARVCSPNGFLLYTVVHPAMLLRGAYARFIDPEEGVKICPKSYPYQVSDYLNSARAGGLSLLHMSEHAADDDHAAISERAEKYKGWPFLLLMKFKVAQRD